MKTVDDQRPVTVRCAFLTDLDAVLRLDQELIRHDLRFDPTLEPDWSFSEEGVAWFRDRIAGPDGIVVVADGGDGLVGYLAGGRCEAESYRHTAPMAEVDCMFLLEAYRGRGIGEKMMERFREWCAENGVGRIRVVACAGSRGAVSFYERMGFEPYDLVLERTLPGSG
jgi:GNAT superfamily N-acetyltransferase